MFSHTHISCHISILFHPLPWHIALFLEGFATSPQAAGGQGLCPGRHGELGTCLQSGPGNHASSPGIFPQVFGFFKGMSFPLASIAVYNSVVFGVFSNTQRFLSQHRCREPGPSAPRSLSDLLLASMVAGVVSVGLGTPVDLIKIRLQMQTQPFREGKRLEEVPDVWTPVTLSWFARSGMQWLTSFLLGKVSP